MYDIIISRRKLNIKKIILLALLFILLVSTCTILGIKAVDKTREKAYADQLTAQEEMRIAEEERLRIEKEQKQKEIELERLNKVNCELTEEQKYNILHIYNSNESEKRVFLTFDDGPTKAVTPFILDKLKQYNVKATFFVLGQNVQYNPDLIVREYNEGHYIANHGTTHEYSKIYSSLEAILAEYNYTDQAIKNALNNQLYKSKVFRFPGGSVGGKYNTIKQEAKQYLQENGIVHLDWNSLSEDAAGSYTKEQLLQNTINTIGDHDSVVILMHDSSDKILTYEMLDDLIKYLQQKNYKFCNIYDLL